MLELLGLNDRQRAAAENLDGHILLTAPAGTGKTDTLAYRIANILESGRAAPEEVLCLKFTNKACQEMRERIASQLDSDTTLFKMNDSGSPTIIQDRDGAAALYVLMPMRV